MIERFAILCVILSIMYSQRPDLFRNQITAPLYILQQKRCAELRYHTDASAVKAIIHHQLQRFMGCAVEGRQLKQVAKSIRHYDF